jgi:hypothetical protein
MTCEKCWNDAYGRTNSDPFKGQSEHYQDLCLERKHTPCSYEDQAGEGAEECQNCKRNTIHIYAKKCVICNQ